MLNIEGAPQAGSLTPVGPVTGQSLEVARSTIAGSGGSELRVFEDGPLGVLMYRLEGPEPVFVDQRPSEVLSLAEMSSRMAEIEVSGQG